MSFLTKILGDPNDREVARHLRRVEEINEFEPAMRAASDEQLRRLTDELRERVSQARGEAVAVSGDETVEQTDADAAAEREKAVDAVLEEILPEAFAMVREVSRRKLGMRHFDVQMVGGIVLHQGKIAEMKTGEGKTLVATLPLFLNALASRGAHLVTVNDYLARRDAGWNAPVYTALGMSVGVIMGPPQQGPGYNQSFIYDPEYRDESHHDERLPFLDDIRGELRPVAAADVLRRVDRSGRDEQDVAGLEAR